MTTIHLVSNSPGEVTTFARPVAAVLRERHPDWNLQLCLVPCPYATGAEAKFIEDWSENVKVWTPWQTTKAWALGTGKGKRGAVVFLGGDPWHALLLKSRFKQPSVAYFPRPDGWETSRWLGGFDRVAQGYKPAQDSDGQRLLGVGDLRIDAVQKRLAECSPRDDALTIAVFPGSRWLHLKAVLGPFLRSLEMVSESIPEIKVILAVSPFVSRERLLDAARKPFSFGLSYTKCELDNDTLITDEGMSVKLYWGDPYQVISNCDLAISLPGTNVAELAIGGKPTVIPLSFRVPIGGGGLLGIVDRLPGLKGLKQRLRERKKAKFPFVGLPNILAGRMIMPELFVDDDMANLAEYLVDLAHDEARRKAIGTEARNVMGEAGAGARVCDLIESVM